MFAGSLSERGAHGGSSADSLNGGGGGGDPSVIKKKKDQLNHSKQKALRVLSGGDHPGSKALVTKTRSAPGGRTQQEEEVTVVAAAVVIHQHDNETDTDNDEIMERDVAIAKVRIYVVRENDKHELQKIAKFVKLLGWVGLAWDGMGWDGMRWGGAGEGEGGVTLMGYIPWLSVVSRSEHEGHFAISRNLGTIYGDEIPYRISLAKPSLRS